jgi:hypothetical protein
MKAAHQSTSYRGVISLAVLFCIFLFVLTPPTAAQQIDIDNFKKNLQQPVKIGGGVSMNTIFYNGNDGQGRQPFTYFLNGNINFNFFNQINLPFTFNITNLGNNLTYPTLPTRLSVHPKYKWITGHIGDVAMNFSPYTLSGHMFRGVGIDLAPKGPWKVNLMGGRLQQSVEYNPANPLIAAAYERMGYGAKVRYDKADYYLGMSALTTKDDPNSLRWQPDSLNIFPKDNTAFSWEGGIKVSSNINISGEYGISMLSRDNRSPREGSSVIDNLIANRTSTQVYRAYRFDVSYLLYKNNIGIGYERIDPDYVTLGAYFFNNDYENLTLRYARPFLKDKMNVALSWGVQRDDLNNTEEQSSKRLVSSANINYAPSEKLALSLSYSDFQTFMNIRSQFNFINGQTPYDNLDTLNFTQLSKNMAFNTNYNFGKKETKKHSLNANLSFQEAANKQGDIIKPGSLTQFYNLGTSYNLLFVPQSINFQAAFNATYNRLDGDDFVTLGPTVGVNAKLIKKKITTRVSVSYNASLNKGETQSEIFNLRWNAGYTFLKKHNLSINTVWQNRNIVAKGTKESFTVTFGYAYSF